MVQLHIMHEKWHPYHVDKTMHNLEYDFYIPKHVTDLVFSRRRLCLISPTKKVL